MRPLIKPGLRVVWRDEETVQIGLTPDRGVVLTGLGPLDADLIARLDGSRDLDALTGWADDRGLGAERARQLVRLLDESGVLIRQPTDRAHLTAFTAARRHDLQPDAAAWSVAYDDGGDGYEVLAERRRHDVLVIGTGRLAELTTNRLTEAGTTVSALPRLSPSAPAASAAVLISEDSPDTAAGSLLVQSGLPHLAVVSGVDRVTVGPFVRPGHSPCLRCLELHRADRDPRWLDIAAQLRDRPGLARGERTLHGLAAAVVALQVAGWLDTRRTPATLSATVTLQLPDGLPVRRRWRAHPSCGCSWLTASRPADVLATLG